LQITDFDGLNDIIFHFVPSKVNFDGDTWDVALRITKMFIILKLRNMESNQISLKESHLQIQNTSTAEYEYWSLTLSLQDTLHIQGTSVKIN